MSVDANNLIEKIAREYQEKLIDSVFKGTLNVFAGVYPTKDVTGRAVKTDDGYLILFANGLFSLIEATVDAFISHQSDDKKLATLRCVDGRGGELASSGGRGRGNGAASERGRGL